MQSQAALAYLQKNRDRFIKELIEYVAFPSVSAQPAHQKDLAACATWLADHCRHIGLKTRLCPTKGNPVLLASTPARKVGQPHFLVYGHYDVQPAEPFDLWKSPAFQPEIRGRSLYGRGASDNKGQHFAHLKGVEALLATGAELPCALTFLIEGEEEVGSSSLSSFLKTHKEELASDLVVISDNGIPSPKHPALTYSLRGVAAFELEMQGPSRDLHSGIYGGSVENPAMALCRLLGQLRDDRGRIAIPGFYDDVVPLSPYERKQLRRVPFDQEAYRRFLGVPQLFGEQTYTPIEQCTARPTLEINGLTSGYQGEGSKTIIPSWARAKLTCRLVPNQVPARIEKLLVRHLHDICPETVKLRVTAGHSGAPYAVQPDSPYAQAALRALKTTYGIEPILTREGGSIPIVNEFKRVLHVDTLLLGLALPDDNPHSPNEKFDLKMFARGMELGLHLWPELAARKKVK